MNTQDKAINKAYDEINCLLNFATIINSKKRRIDLVLALIQRLPFLEKVVCDETNNFCEIISQGLIAATIYYYKPGQKNGEYYYRTLTFGGNFLVKRKILSEKIK